MVLNLGKQPVVQYGLIRRKQAHMSFTNSGLIQMIETLSNSYAIFTFLHIATINGLEISQQEDPGAREPQKRLAEEVTKMVHGEAALEQAIKIYTALFSGDVKQLTKEEIEQGFKD